MILRRLVCTPDATGTVVDVVKFNDVVRIMAISVEVADNAAGLAGVSVRWRVLSKDGLLTIPNLAAQSDINPGATPALRWVVFMVNQPRQPAIADIANALELSPGFLPPDMWLQPSEMIRIELKFVSGGPPDPSITSCIVSYLDAEPPVARKKKKK